MLRIPQRPLLLEKFLPKAREVSGGSPRLALWWAFLRLRAGPLFESEFRETCRIRVVWAREEFGILHGEVKRCRCWRFSGMAATERSESGLRITRMCGQARGSTKSMACRLGGEYISGCSGEVNQFHGW
jgi:hypothetical protein